MKLIAAASVGLVAAQGQANVELARARRQLAGFERAVASNGAVITATNFGIAEEGYGCWCYFGDDHLERKAKGIPLDNYDKACHALSRAYECAIIDSEQDALEGTCTPWLVDYEVVTVAEGNDYNALCKAANADAAPGSTEQEQTDAFCTQRACMIESLFTERIRNLALTLGEALDATLQHTHADWETTREAKCVGVKDSPGRDLTCCGTYPQRYPLNNNAANKKCCADEHTGINGAEVGVYNTGSHQCCNTETSTGSGIFDAEIIQVGELCDGNST